MPISVAKMIVLVGICALAIGGCANEATSPTTNTSTTMLISPSPITLDTIGQTQNVSAMLSGYPSGPPSTCFFLSTNNTSIASVASTSNGFIVSAVNWGTTSLAAHFSVTCQPPFAPDVQVPVSVWPNGTWKGSVTFQGACAGSDPAYGETVQIAVDGNGVGTLTAIDTPGFNRQYAITIPSSLNVTSTGNFAYLTTTVPGRINVTFLKTQIDYLETTSYNTCSNTYHGLLSKGS